MQFLRFLVNQVPSVALSSEFPGRTFEEKSVNVSSVLSGCGDILRTLELGHVGLYGHVIQRHSLLSGCELHNGSQEGHGVEEV